jgi:protein O-GlcNAc transferase
VGRGNILLACSPLEAIQDYTKAIALRANSAGVLYNRGTAFTEIKHLTEALSDYDKALLIEPDLPYLEDARLHAKTQMCDWRNFEEESALLLSHVAACRKAAMPFVILPVASTPEYQRTCAKLYAQAKYLEFF